MIVRQSTLFCVQPPFAQMRTSSAGGAILSYSIPSHAHAVNIIVAGKGTCTFELLRCAFTTTEMISAVQQSLKCK